MSVMRRRAFWLQMLALFALAAANLPASAIASWAMGEACKMPCCEGKPAHEAPGKSCAKACAGKAAAKKPTSEAAAGKRKECRCEIRSAPTQPTQTAIASASAPVKISSIDADLGRELSAPAVLAAAESTPGIFGTDSGPPDSWPNYASLGRAPPVLLA
jgi:hypothetical protein